MSNRPTSANSDYSSLVNANFDYLTFLPGTKLIVSVADDLNH
jgi:hypothetical protein